MVKIIINNILLFLIASASSTYAAGYEKYTYKVRSGDTLSEIALMFTGNLNYKKIAKANKIENPDLIKPGKRIRLEVKKPILLLDKYLEAIYDNKTETAYELLLTHTKANLSITEFKDMIKERTEFDMNSFEVISDTLWNKHIVLLIQARLDDDPATWGFNLIRENGKWRVLVLNHNPTFP